MIEKWISMTFGVYSFFNTETVSVPQVFLKHLINNKGKISALWSYAYPDWLRVQASRAVKLKNNINELVGKFHICLHQTLDITGHLRNYFNIIKTELTFTCT